MTLHQYGTTDFRVGYDWQNTAITSDGRTIMPTATGPITMFDSSGNRVRTIQAQTGSEGGLYVNNPTGVTVLANGDFVVSGSMTNSAAGFQIYNADGTQKTTGGVTVWTGLYAAPNFGKVLALPDGGFVMVWNNNSQIEEEYNPVVTGPGATGSIGNASVQDIWMQTFDANGVAVTGATLITHGEIFLDDGQYGWESRAGSQYLSDIDINSNGDIVISYRGDRFDSYGNAFPYANFRTIDPQTMTQVVGETPYVQTGIGLQSPETPQQVHSGVQTAVLTSGVQAGVFVNSPGPDTEGPYAGFNAVMLQLRDNGGAPVGETINLGIDLRDGNNAPTIAIQPDDSGGFYLLFSAYAAGATRQNGKQDFFVGRYRADGTQIESVKISNGEGNLTLGSFTKGPDGTYTINYYSNTAGPTSGYYTKHFVETAGSEAFADLPNNANTQAFGNAHDFVFGNGGADNLSGGGGRDRIHGGLANDTLNGGDAADTLWGDIGDDRMDGGTYADTMYGGVGNDIYYVDHGGDRTVEIANEGIDRVLSTVSLTLGANIEILSLVGAANLTGNGNTLDNRLIGNTGDNLLQGRAGNDTIDGGDGNDQLKGEAGDDSMTGGLGNDVFYVDTTGDRTIEAANGGIDTVYSSVSRTLSANIETLRLSGPDGLTGNGNELANKLFGNAGANKLQGFAGADTIQGKDGNDTIAGGEGNDTLTGGIGADVFRFATSSAGIDTITDFNRNQDRFDLGGGSFSALSTAPNGDAVLTHNGGAIRINNPSNLTLAQWNALVVPSGGGNAVTLHEGHGPALAHAHELEIVHLGLGDWAYA